MAARKSDRPRLGHSLRQTPPPECCRLPRPRTASAAKGAPYRRSGAASPGHNRQCQPGVRVSDLTHDPARIPSSRERQRGEGTPQRVRSDALRQKHLPSSSRRALTLFTVCSSCLIPRAPTARNRSSAWRSRRLSGDSRPSSLVKRRSQPSCEQPERRAKRRPLRLGRADCSKRSAAVSAARLGRGLR